MEEAFRECVLAQPAVSALLGPRLYPMEFPQDPTFPAATYQTISGPREYTQDGPDRVTRFRVQMRIRATTPDGANAVRNAFKNSAAHGVINELFGGSPPTTKLLAIFIDNEVTETDPPLAVTGPRLYGMRLDLIVWATEPVT